MDEARKMSLSFVISALVIFSTSRRLLLHHHPNSFQITNALSSWPIDLVGQMCASGEILAWVGKMIRQEMPNIVSP
jgi:hypothetical protein